MIERETDRERSALLGTYKRAPMKIVRGEGVELFDEEGHAYLDFTSGIAVNALGYNDPGLLRVMHEATKSGLVHISNLFRSDPGEALARTLTERSFASSVFFCNSGVEANEGAFKFVRRWARGESAPGKMEIVALRGGFHGRLFASLAATDRPQYRAPFMPLAGGVSISERDLNDLDSTLDGECVAAVICEPVQGEGGVRVLEPDFLHGLREMTKSRGIALIFDEIQCGLGRTGRLFAYENTGVIPDIVTLAKPIAGGLPMGAILMTAEIAAAIEPGDHGTTFGGGPFVTSVAQYVVDRLSDPGLLATVRENGSWFADRLREMGERTGKIRSVRGIGYMWGVDVVEPAADIVTRCREEKLLILTAGEHTLRILPPLIANRTDLERGLALLERTMH